MKYLILALTLSASGAAAAAPAGQASLAGTGWSAALHGGVLVELRNRLTDELLVQPGEPVARTGVRRVRETLLTTEAAAQVSGDAGRLDAAWPAGVRLSQTAEATGGELVVRQTVTAAEPPLVGALWGVGAIPAEVEVLVPGHSGLRFGPGAPDGTWNFEYPISWEAQFVLLQGKRGGFLIWTDDTTPQFKALSVQRRQGRTALVFETRATAPFANVKEIRSVAWRVRPYKGAWLEGARVYREWAEKAFGLAAIRAARPAWAGRIRFVAIVPMEMGLLDALAKQVRPEQTLLYVPNWRRDGYDRNYPDYTALPEFGPWNERAHALGFRVMPHVNYFGCDPLNPLYEQFRAQQMRDPFRNELLWWDWTRATPPIKFAYINPASRAWRQLFVSRMKELCTRYQVDALHLDQTLCIFNDNNGIIDGMNCMQGALALHRDLREALPNVAISGEGLNEVSYRYEEFTQRHLWGLQHSEGTWSDRLIAMAHPVSSSLLTPHTTIYGYLGMSGPLSGGLYQAWRRGYDHFGVIPTLSHITAQQLRDNEDRFAPHFAEARFFQETQALPDFAAPWPADAVMLYRVADGGRALLRRDLGVALVAGVPGKERTVYRRVEGVSEAALPGSIAGWRAYDDRRLLGLDPGHSYTYVDRPRDPAAFHVEALPEGAVVRAVGVRDDLATVSLDDRLSQVARLWEFAGPSEAGVRLFDGKERRYPGTTFNDESGGSGQPEGEGIFLHPPWKVTAKDEKTGINLAQGIGVSFIEYRLRLPDRPRIRFEAGVGLREGAVGKSDGATFRVEVRSGDQTLEAKAHHAGADPAPLALDLSPLRGKEITVRLETHPGPQGQATFDWAVITRPLVVAEDPSPRRVVVYSPKPVLAALGGTAAPLAVRPAGEHRYAVEMPLPGAAILAFSLPEATAALPMDLRTAPRSAGLVFPDGMVTQPMAYSRPAAGEAAVGGVNKPALHAHPPQNGRLSVDYLVRLPQAPAHLEAFAGIRDTSLSAGVGFVVQVNGREVWSANMLPKQPWKPVSVDLSAYAGQVVLLSLVTDSLGGYDFDWAVWGEPKLVGK